jgi:hypothetical protein
MMTTDWAAIGRRLAVRRTSHRPPWSARKTGHRSILAPIAARAATGVAATVAVGVGLALARAERERRAERARQAAQRQFALLPGERPAQGLKRMALAQIDLAIELLGGLSQPDERAVHETRKALKRLRALVRLLRYELGTASFARENTALRELGRRLAGARDAEVMVASLDAIRRRHPRELGGEGMARLRDGLVAERNAAAARTLGDVALRAQVLAELHAVRTRVAAWQLPDAPALELVELGLERLYRQGRARRRRAARGSGDRGRALHEWRKRVKDLRHAAEMLDRSDPAGARGRVALLSRGTRGGRRADELRKVAERADQLAEMLGEEHDLAVLAARIREQRTERPRLRRRTRKRALKLIARRRRKLRARSLRAGATLYGRRPKRFVEEARRDYRRGSRRSR